MDILNWTGLLDILFAPFMWALNGIIFVLGYTLYYIYDGLLTVVGTMISGLDLSSVGFNFLSELSGLPSPLLYLLNAVAFPQCLTIISGAYGIRQSLNLIPNSVTRL